MRPGTIAFHRPARVHPAPVQRDVVALATPPPVPEPIGNAVWQVLAPVLGSAGMVGFALVLGEQRYMIMAGLIAGVMLLSGVISRVVQVRSERKRRATAAFRYRAHLTEARGRLDRAASMQRTAAESAHPAPAELVGLVETGARTWERRSHHGDFLTVRLGTATVAADVAPQLETSHDPMSQPEPDLLDEAQALEADTRLLQGVPVAADLSEAGCVAIVGDRESGRRVAASMLMQYAALRSPSELSIVAHIDRTDAVRWEWLKWLPHTRANLTGADDGRTLLTTSAPDFGVVLDQIATPRLEAIERQRSTRGTSESLSFRQVVVLIDGYAPSSEAGQLERLDSVLSVAADVGMLIVAIVDHPDDIPSHAGATVKIGRNGTIDFSETRPAGLRISDIVPDTFDGRSSERLARSLAPLRTRSSGTPAGLDSAGLLQLLGEQGGDVDPERLWRTTTEPLTTPIGLCAGDEPFVLDIREASAGGMGPHGILIGATGSGKSELLRTLVLGLALRNPPEELSFVLADFKGGATFAGLEELPHTAGTISNIEADPTLIDRMQEALFGEMERRQRVLRESGFDRADEYRQHRRLHPEARLDPLPACLVVVDEFGELLATRPEFVDLFSSIGRTGRSLGVHLLLSSQRLDEGRIRKVESHLRYRICLRTFSPEESVAVLGSRASYDLPPVPGLGHVSVDGALTQFKAGLVNRPIRATTHHAATSGSVQRFEIGGPGPTIGVMTSREAAPPQVAAATEMAAITERLEAVDRSVRPVWLPPLPDRLSLQDTESPSPLATVIGVTDLPRLQCTTPAVLDFGGTGGNLAVVGGPRSGKSTTLATIVTSFAGHRSPSDIAFYGIDLGGGLLHRLEGLPHVGSVFGRSHRDEIPRLVRQLHAMVERRVDEFRIHGLTSMTDFHRARTNGTIDSPWGDVFLVVDNWGLFNQEFGLEMADLVGEILSGGLHYGVHVILSASRWQDIRMSHRDHIGGRFELRLTDPIETEIDRHAARQLPTDLPGRALDGSGRLTQVALPPEDLASIAGRWTGAATAPPVRMLPSLVTEEDMASLREGAVGITEHELAAWSPDLLTNHPHFIVLGDGEAGKTTALRGIIRSLEQAGPAALEIGVIDYRRRLRTEVGDDRSMGHASTPEEAQALVARILSEVGARTPSEESASASRPEIVLVVDDYDLVAGASGNPIGPLVDLVPRGSDLGFHLVVARRVAGLARSSFEPVLQRLRESGTPTLIMDGDPSEGPIVGSVKAARQPTGRGLLVDRSRSTLIQIARFEPRARIHVLPREQSA